MKGKVVEDFGVPIIEVHWMEKLPLIDRNKDLGVVSLKPQALNV
jgi:hypothetical protein